MNTESTVFELSSMINTTLVPHSAFNNAVERIEQCFRYASISADPICLPLHGESRTGKTTVLDEVLRAHPATRDSDCLRVPILRVSTPSKPTVKGLVELLLQAIGDPRYYVGTENIKTSRLKLLMQEAGTRMVVIDEFQHFVDKGSLKVMHHVADWLKVFVDDAGVALVVSGLPICQAVVDQNEQLRGRFLSPVVMPRFDWSNEQQRGEFVATLAAFRMTLNQHFDLPQFDNANMAFRFYVGSGGLIGYVVKFLKMVVWNAVDSKVTCISLKDLHSAHLQSVWNGDNATLGPSPFSKNFKSEPTEASLANAKFVGVPAAPAPKGRASKKKAKSPTMNSTLAAA
tara:strand:- start:6947 stop:7975 length:1029 start_codon:yes stop_codon:yes gene_type:complete